MDRIDIERAASRLEYDWIILDSLDAIEDDEITEDVAKYYMETIDKIANIESKYTDEEIQHGNLLCDIW